MSSFWGQLRALVWLTSKQMGRRALRAGEAPRAGKPTAAILIAVSYLYLLGIFYNLGRRISDLSDGRVSSLRMVVWGTIGLSLSTAMIWSAPQIGRIRPVLRAPMLDLLPLGGAVKVVVGWLQGYAFIVCAPVLYFAAAPEARKTVEGVAFVLALAVFGSLAGSLLGQLLSSLARVSNVKLLVLVFPWIGVGLSIAPLALLMNAPVLGPRFGEDDADPMLAVGQALLGGDGRSLAVAAFIASAIVLAGLLWACERIGYDREDRPSSSRFKSSALGSPTRIELRLLWRQGTSKMHAFQMVMMTGLLVVVISIAWRGGGQKLADDMNDRRQLLFGLLSQVVLFTSLSLFNSAATAVARDLQARPLLSALPSTPAQTLDQKARALRLLTLPIFVGLLALAVVFLLCAPRLGTLVAISLAIRVGLLGAGLWLVCGIAAPIAFLTRGLGAGEGSRQGMPPLIVSALIFLPLLSIAILPSWPQAVAALLVLAALAFEARRSAARCVSWIDDGGQSERDTAVWRALLALGGFFSAQALAAQAFQFVPVDEATRLALVFLVGGITLVVLTLRSRPPTDVRSTSIGWDLTGVLAGAASGGIGLLFGLLLAKLGFDGGDQRLSGGLLGRAALGLAVVVVAPVCEELFFRGWLQAAIAKELGPRARWAPLCGALAFAGAHVGSALVPQLVLGLVAGVLFARTGRLRPGIFAHAAHNAVVVVLGLFG